MNDFFLLCRNILAEHLNIQPDLISMDTTFEEINADSIDIVEMIMAVEDKYDVEFPEDDLDKFKTMGSLIKVLYEYLNSR
ncbi:MAG: acyl carrier protein [Chitinophagales bacterium]